MDVAVRCRIADQNPPPRFRLPRPPCFSFAFCALQFCPGQEADKAKDVAEDVGSKGESVYVALVRSSRCC